LGGDNLRGFETAGAGPRDLNSQNQDSLGGKILATGTVEVRFPVGLPEELGVLASVFSDVGLLTETDDDGGGVVDKGTIRASVGVGFSWRSPFGPIRVDVAKPLLEEDFDKTETLRLSFGTRF
jgi:outer membrane protein insertion porin family